MRFVDLSLIIATAGSFVGAVQPHRHHHHHNEKRAPSPDTEVITVPGPIVYAFEFNGKSMTQDEVCQGIFNETLSWAPGTDDPPLCDGPSAISPSASSQTSIFSGSASSTAPAGNELFQKQSTTTAGTTSSTPTTSSAAVVPTTAVASAPASSPPPSSSSSSGQPVSGIASNANVGRSFPDGELDCSHFPEDYGAIPISWMDMGGWSGLQYVTISGNSVTNIVTGTPGSTCANDADGTAMCSYACPPGYQKSQWPTTQGSTGQSVGGLLCGPDNKLHLTNKALSTQLCIEGTGGVSVENTLGSNVPICRTDYPGTEDETVPLDVPGGSTGELACPDESTYYQHESDPTSAQYYINPSGTAVSDACTWSTNGTHVGNFAPAYLGVGTDSSGKTWLSMSSTQQQNPSNYQPLDYTIELQGDFGGSNACFMTVQDGTAYYCAAGTPSSFSKGDCKTYVKCDGSGSPCNECPGCTVQLRSGSAKYVLS